MNKKCLKCGEFKVLTEFCKRKATKDGLQSYCKTCYIPIKKKNRQTTKCKEARIKESYKQRNKEGLGVYIATYPSGIYIGSGQLAARRDQHMTGHSDRSKKLNQKATKFKIVWRGSKQESLEIERDLIKSYGLDTLLNTKV